MSVECVAILVTNRPFSVHTYRDNESIDRNLCHLKLVQLPQTKRDKVPTPKWHIVSILESADTLTTKDISRDIRKGEIVRTGSLFEKYNTLEHPVLVTDISLLNAKLGPGRCNYVQMIWEIEDLRLTRKQIRCLFPECAKMPMWMALDYVRDRM